MIHALLLGLALSVPADSLVYDGSEAELQVGIPRVAAPDVTVDGRLDETVWSSAAVLTGFTQYEPVEGEPLPERTEILVFYASDAIYFGVRAYDRRPELIQARLGERDRAAFTDDWVRLMLDTYDDQRQAYVLYVNPLGLQTDGLWIEGMERRGGGGVSIDFNPDFIWESEGRVTGEGWVAEIRVPYVSLRFRNVPLQDWGFNVAREIKRSGFKGTWAPLTQENPSTLAQSGRLVGLRDLEPQRLVEVNPVATGRRTGALDGDGTFRRDGFEGDLGVNARLGITQNLTLDATVNPDFSQVEADAGQLTVNERFAVFFPEKRPFFLEGSEIWQMPRNLVHTRQIVSPSVGAKLTGKVGAFQAGYLGALDRVGNAVFNIVRLRRDVGTGSTLGAVYTDRTASSDAYNRVAGADARFLMGRHTLTALVAGSWTAEATEAAEAAGGADGAGPPETSFGPLLRARIARTGRVFQWDLRLDDVHPDFRTRSGFINRVGDTELFGSASWSHYGAPGALLEQARLELRSNNFFDHDEFWKGSRPFEHELELSPSLSFRGERNLSLVLRNGYYRFQPEDYTDYGVLSADGESVEPFRSPPSLKNMLALALMPRLRLTDAVNLNGQFFFREIPIFAEARRGFEVQLGPDLTLRPTSSLALTLDQTYSRIERAGDGSVYSTAHISRLNAQYQFSRAVFARFLIQYDLEERDALTDPTTGRPLLRGGQAVPAVESGELQGQLLFQYEPSPGTIFYVGYSRLEEGDRTFRPSGLDPVEDGLFMKMSYLFRL